MIHKEDKIGWLIVLLTVICFMSIGGILHYQQENAVLQERISWYEKLYGPIEQGYIPAYKNK